MQTTSENRTHSLCRLLGVLAAVLVAGCGPVQNQAARDYISIVGSSTVYPFSTVAAERFGRATRFRTPKVEATGSGGGIKLFCNGIGVQHPDVANSSRRILASEMATCARNGVAEIIEVKIGYDGIVLANARSAVEFDVTLRDVYLALAKQVPDPAGGEGLVPNPYRRWSDIAPALPDVQIEVLGPPPTSGTRDAFLELVMEPGCESFAQIAALERNRFLTVCHTIREEGAYVEAGENDNLIVQKLSANPNALGIFGFSFLEQNGDKIRGSKVAGIAPTFDSIADRSYPVSRPLYFYAKRAHADFIPGLREYLLEFTGDAATGEFGYLADNGLIPLPPGERDAVAADVRALTPLVLSSAD